MKFVKLLVISLLFIPVFTSELCAQELQGKFQDWNVFKTERGDRTICYLASVPIKRDGNNYERRGESFFLVTNIENDADEVSASAGFVFNQKSDIEISFGSKKFYLFPYRTMAWANDKNDDIDIIKDMQKHENFVITAISRDGKVATDIYSLVGFSLAYAKMKEVCKSAK